ncbi:MAG TPA: tetratricopeptide repeat protein [Flavobacterium sp.]|uniref:tetratricopeptide repeat protein n=1 Tax=Flavobacterium sp. TaxID=239 RepID=UPI002BEA4461|nr:tetratricopeptide repeat protein [Flavobacterium sp.]HNP32688.1 tetratricopeptide repeat protein [Flavobacterium sp.]
MKKLVFILLLVPTLIFSQTNYEKAEKLFTQEKYSLAKPLFEAALKDSPGNLKIIEYLGDIASNMNDWEKAAFYYEKLKTSKPNNADYYFKYGGALGMRAQTGGKWVAIRLIGDIRESLEKAIVLNPNHIEARWALIEYYLQLPGFIGGSEKKAQHYSNELFKISPIDGYLSKAHIDEYFKRYKSAEQYYIKAIQIGGSKQTYERLAQLYKDKLNQPEKALEVLKKYQEKNKS